MSDEPTARDVIAAGIRRDFYVDANPNEVSEEEYDLASADALLAALAAAGWELHQTGEVVPTARHEQMAQAAADWRARHDHLLVSVVLLADDIHRGPSAYTIGTISREIRALARQSQPFDD